MPGQPSERIEVGRIVKPHGIRGEVVVALLTDRPERLRAGERLHGAGRTFTVVRSRPHQGRMLVTFEDVADRSAAEALRGTVLEADRDGEPEEDTYLASELVGMAVVDDRGRDLGTVDALIELPAAAQYDLLEVRRHDDSTWLLPAVEDYVGIDEGPDGTERLVVTSPPPGLLDEAGEA